MQTTIDITPTPAGLRQMRKAFEQSSRAHNNDVVALLYWLDDEQGDVFGRAFGHLSEHSQEMIADALNLLLAQKQTALGEIGDAINEIDRVLAANE